MTLTDTAPVLAAGAVCWREDRAGTVEVLLISRSRHDDVSLPKGKVDDTEALPAAAVREIREETGYGVTLGAPLGLTEYVLPGGRDKVVHYWCAEVPQTELRRGRFRPSDEVQAVEWVPLAKAARRLSYPRDRDVLERFATLVERNRHRTFALIALRHAKAEQDSPDGTDAARPLTSRGKRQAEAVVSALSAFAPEKILSSPAKRCLDTVRPLAAALGLEVRRNRMLSQEAWEGRGATEPRAELDKLAAKRVTRARTAVFSTHSPVLPVLLDAIVAQAGGERDGRLTRAAILTTAEFTVVHLAAADPRSGIVALETHTPPV